MKLQEAAKQAAEAHNTFISDNDVSEILGRAGFSRAETEERCLEYLEKCMPDESYNTKQGATVHSLTSVLEETGKGVGPGGIICPYGFLPVLGTLGGNQICLFLESAEAYLVHHSYIGETYAILMDANGKRTLSRPISKDSILKGGILVSNSPSHLLSLVLNQKLAEFLDQHD